MRMRKLPWAQDFLKEQEVVVPDASALAGAWKQTLKRAELHHLHPAAGGKHQAGLWSKENHADCTEAV